MLQWGRKLQGKKLPNPNHNNPTVTEGQKEVIPSYCRQSSGSLKMHLHVPAGVNKSCLKSHLMLANTRAERLMKLQKASFVFSFDVVIVPSKLLKQFAFLQTHSYTTTPQYSPGMQKLFEKRQKKYYFTETPKFLTLFWFHSRTFSSLR